MFFKTLTKFTNQSNRTFLTCSSIVNLLGRVKISNTHLNIIRLCYITTLNRFTKEYFFYKL